MRDDSGLIVIGCRQLKKMSLMQSTDAGHGPDWALMTPITEGLTRLPPQIAQQSHVF